MKFEKLSNNSAKFTFDVTKEEFEHGLEHAYEHIKKDVSVEGFRKGNVPQNIYENKYGVESLFEDALNHVFAHKFDEAILSKKAEIVGNPEIDLDYTTVKKGEGFTFSFIVPTKPDVILGQYKEIEIEKDEISVSSEEVELAIEQALEKASFLGNKAEGSLEMGDTAIFDFKGLKDGVAFEGGTAENHQLEIGSGQFIPGFEEQMLGMMPEEEKTIDITFPEDYHAEDLKGQAVKFEIKLWEIKQKIKPELNDEFVRNQNNELKTVEEYKKHLENDLMNAKQLEEKNRIINSLVQKVGENAEIDVPQAMVDGEVERYKNQMLQQIQQYGIDLETYVGFTGQTMEQFEQQVNELSLMRVREYLALEKVGEVEKIAATKAEVDQKYQEIADMYKMSIKEVKQHIQPEMIEKEVVFNKTIDFIYDNSKLIEKKS
jgi:trigger factor